MNRTLGEKLNSSESDKKENVTVKKIVSSLIAALLVFSSAGCAQQTAPTKKQTESSPERQEQKEDAVSSEPQDSKLDLNPKIFKKDVKNKTISKAEMKKDIQTYLNADHDITRIYEHYQQKLHSDKGLSKEDAKQLKKASQLAGDNDNNFANYINENRMPKGYDGKLHKINRYIMSSNQYLRDIDEKIDNALAASKGKRLSKQEIGDIAKGSDTMSEREQKKIKGFVEDEQIDTRAFK